MRENLMKEVELELNSEGWWDLNKNYNGNNY
jgi:hypothetical protein